ncbi:MAG: transcription termination factor NusA, partial [Deltaproteobacteria bacterium]|nr:transcription termination factor NusA [Deltaproteobacteria bacterium]
MKSGGLLEAIVELSHERGLEQESIIEAIEDAIVGAAYRKYKNYRNIEASFNRQSGEIELMHFKVVVDNLDDEDNQILLSEVLKLDPQAECGDEVEYIIDSSEFTNVIAQTARQLIFQKIGEAEKETIIEKYQEKKGEIIHGTISRGERGSLVMLVGQSVEAVIEKREQIPFEKLQPGEHVRALLIDIRTEGKGPMLVASRTHPAFLMKLMEVEVPEVYDEVIEVVSAAREPGKRAKVAVKSNDPDVDPVGSCVGVRGTRIQAVVSELCGERIDVIEWSGMLEQFIANALAPAEIMEMTLDKEHRVADIKVAADQLSLAIGKQGQNVRLASKLTNVTINISPWEIALPAEADNGDVSDEQQDLENGRMDKPAMETRNKAVSPLEAAFKPDKEIDDASEEAVFKTPEEVIENKDGNPLDAELKQVKETEDTSKIETQAKEVDP